MRIGLTGGGATVDKVVHQAKQAEADGFTSLWYASVVTGDPLVAMAIAGKESSTIELGTRCCRPIRVIPFSRPTGPPRLSTPWDAAASRWDRALPRTARQGRVRPLLRPSGP